MRHSLFTLYTHCNSAKYSHTLSLSTSLFLSLSKSIEMEGGGHRRSKSASSSEGVSPIQKFKSRFSSDSSSHSHGSSSAERFMERGESSSVQVIESPRAKYLAEKVFKEAEPKSSSPSGMARLMRLESLNSLWNSKQKTKVAEGHRQDNVSSNTEPDRQPLGCLLYNRRMSMKKKQFSKKCDDPEPSHFVSHRRSSEWSASSMPTRSEVGLPRQKIDTNYLPIGELVDARNLDSINQRASSSGTHPERMDGLLLERHNRYGAHTSPRILNTQADGKKKKDGFPRPIVFPRSDIRNIPTAEEVGTSSSYTRINIPNFRKMREYQGFGTSEGISQRMNGSSQPISDESRELAREITRQLRDALAESEEEMYPDARGSDLWGRHPSPGSATREGNGRVFETLKITRTFRDSEVDDDTRALRQVIVIPDGETRYNNLSNRGSDRSSPRLGTDSRSSILGGPSRSRSLPPTIGRVHERGRDTCLNAKEKHVMQSDPPISRGRRMAVMGNPVHNSSLASQASSSRGKMPLPFPPIRIREMGSTLEATFEIPREPNAEDFSEQQLRSSMNERDDDSGDTVYDIMVDKQEISTLPSDLSAFQPGYSSEDDESSAADDQEEDSRLQGGHAGSSSSPSLNQFEAEPPRFSESSNDAATLIDIPYEDDDASDHSSGIFDRLTALLNELRRRLQLESGEDESWEDLYTLDVVIHSSFQDFGGSDMLPIMWNYPDHALDPSLFDTLEKQFEEVTPELRPERLLLFGRIDSALSEMFQKHFDLGPWLMPELGLLSRRRPSRDIGVEKLISQETTNRQLIERILLREMQWEDPVEEFASMGSEIEEVLLDDIIGEFVCDLMGLVDVVYEDLDYE